jgi:hypothetical protein
MAFFPALSRVAIAAMVASLPFAGSGACGSRSACFQYTTAEYNQNNMSCPNQNEALANFTNPECPGTIVSVDGAGTFDGTVCCYPVTYDDSLTNNCTGGNGSGASGTGGTVTTTFTSTTSTGTGSTTSCPPTCAAALGAGMAPCGTNAAVSAWQTLLACACSTGDADGGGGCGTPCSSFCQALGTTPDCTVCLQGTCGMQVAICQAN